MTLSLVRLANIIFAALIAGGMFVIWVGYDPAALSPSTYVEQQQNAIRALNVVMPVLGAIVVAAAFLIISGLVTRFGNQPINALVMSWDIARPPANWTELRDQWWGFHRLRTLCGLIALALITWSSINPGRTSK